MQELGIQSAELTAEDKAALASAPPLEADESAGGLTDEKPVAEGSPAYIEELQKLAVLRDQGILTDEEFEAKKKQLLGL